MPTPNPDPSTLDTPQAQPQKPSRRRWLLLYAAPPAIVICALVAVAIGIALLKPEIEPLDLPDIAPTVEVFTAHPGPVQIEIISQGTAMPQTQTVILAEVSGRVESISPALYPGGRFQEGDTLAEIDSTDYRSALAAARSRVADARLVFLQEQAAADQAKEDWADMERAGEADPLLLREPQLARAKAMLEAAEAALAQAERDLQRTTITAPYDGQVREKFVDIGHVVNARATQIASIYATNSSEVRLPISVADTRLLGSMTANEASPQASVVLESDYAGERRVWRGVIDRSEGMIDERSRLLYLVARIDNASAAGTSSQIALPPGLFVQARVEGKHLESAYTIPRRALRRDDSLHLIDQDDRLIIRPVEVLQRREDYVVVTNGLQAGDRICLTPLAYAVNGMQLKPAEEESESAVIEIKQP